MNIKKMFFVVLVAALPVSSYCQTFGLAEALDKKDTVKALALIKKGGNVNALNSFGNSPLMSACRWDDVPMVSFLLRHGANANDPKSAKGRGPLHLACASTSGKTICAMLIEKGAGVNAAATDGATPLMLAAMGAKLDVVQLLIDKGANIDAKDKSGKTALEYAQEAGVNDSYIKSVKDSRIDKDGVIALLKKGR